MDPDAPSSPDQDKAPEQQPVRQASDSAQELRRDTQGDVSGLGKFWAELKRRKVVRVAVTYIIAAIAIIEFASATFGWFDIPVWAFRLVTLSVICGFPIAVIIAWAFELTPEGIKTTKSAQEEKRDERDSTAHSKKRNWAAYAIGAAIPTVIFGVLALFFYIRSGGDAGLLDGEKSIAVLPFDNRSNLADDQFFTDGIHDDLLNQISRIKAIKSIARTSVMAYKDTTKRMSEIGEELGVNWLLEGGVQRGGDQIRINVTLIEAATNTQTWGDTYTRPLTAENIFEIQNEIVALVTDRLKAVILPEEKERLNKLPTENLAALEAYFKALEATEGDIMVGGVAGQQEAIDLLKEAIVHDPDFALAHATLGRRILSIGTLAGIRDEKTFAEAEVHIERALELEGMSSEAYTAFGVLKRRQGDWQASEEAFQRAIEINPNYAMAYWSYGTLLGQLGDHEERIGVLQKFSELAPNSIRSAIALADSMALSGLISEAQALYESLVKNDPQNLNFQFNLSWFYQYYLGHFDKAITGYRQIYALEPSSSRDWGEIVFCHRDIGELEKSLRWIDRYLLFQNDPLRRLLYLCEKFELTGNNTAREESALKGLEGLSRQRDEFQPNRFLEHLTDIALVANQPENVRKLWEDHYPQLFDTPVNVDGANIRAAKDIARVLMALGEVEKANSLIRASVTALSSLPPDLRRKRLDVLINALTGDQNKTLDALRDYFDSGGSPYQLEREVGMETFLENPEYQAMAEKRKAELAIQRQRIREMEANGELPLIPELPAN